MFLILNYNAKISAVKDKLINLLSKLRGFKFEAILAWEFKKI